MPTLGHINNVCVTDGSLMFHRKNINGRMDSQTKPTIGNVRHDAKIERKLGRLVLRQHYTLRSRDHYWTLSTRENCENLSFKTPSKKMKAKWRRYLDVSSSQYFVVFNFLESEEVGSVARVNPILNIAKCLDAVSILWKLEIDGARNETAKARCFGSSLNSLLCDSPGHIYFAKFIHSIEI